MPFAVLPSTFAVIQDVDNTSLEGQFQSFASLMEQRLAELFVLASQQGTRFRRATTVGSYTVQVRHWQGRPQRMPSPRESSLSLTEQTMCGTGLCSLILVAYWPEVINVHFC